VLGDVVADRRGARADAACEVGGGEITLVERAQVVAERAHPHSRERRDDDERQSEGSEAHAEASCQWEILEALHGGRSLKVGGALTYPARPTTRRSAERS
jgi:hypothetical protein